MSGFFTDFVNNKILDLFLGSCLLHASCGLVTFGLSQTTANKGGTVTEPSGGGYARVAVTNNLTSFPSASSGSKSNAVAIQFPSPTASWGTITTVFIADAATGGDVLAMAESLRFLIDHDRQLGPTNCTGSACTCPILEVNPWHFGFDSNIRPARH